MIAEVPDVIKRASLHWGQVLQSDTRICWKVLGSRRSTEFYGGGKYQAWAIRAVPRSTNRQILPVSSVSGLAISNNACATCCSSLDTCRYRGRSQDSRLGAYPRDAHASRATWLSASSSNPTAEQLCSRRWVLASISSSRRIPCRRYPGSTNACSSAPHCAAVTPATIMPTSLSGVSATRT